MYFVVDCMLGKLARWLRLSGYNVIYAKLTDEKILEISEKEGRIILTRDIVLHAKACKYGVKSVYLHSGELISQLKQLIEELGIEIYDTPEHSLCPICGGEISEISKEEAKNKVPNKILQKIPKLYACKKCGKIYWEGTHWNKIREIVKCIKSHQTKK